MKNTTYTHAGKQDKLQNSVVQTQSTIPPVIKLGVDWHAEDVRVVRMIDGLTPQPAQRFSHGAFVRWLEQQRRDGARVVMVYEAGPGGFHLYRQVTALGVECHVVCPERLDPRAKGVVNDASDARELVLKLDRFLSGNHRAMSRVRVPTVEEEQRRALGRQRQQLHKERQRLAAQARSLCLTQGIRLLGPWWKRPLGLPAWLEQRLAVWRKLIEAVEEQLEVLSQAVGQLAPVSRPKGLGPLTLGLLETEICCWDRFTNRKQMGSFTGLCGGVSSSGQSHCDLSITKAGHAQLRWLLIEAAWRLVYYQPQCRTVQRWAHLLLRPQVHTRQRKRAIVAVARQLGVDLWRWRTGRLSAEQLGWIMV